MSTPASPLRLPPRFKVFLWLVVSVNLVFIAIALWGGIKWHNNPAHYFDEGRLGTRLSVLHLLVTGFAALITMWHRKKETPWYGWRTMWVIWALIGAGFIFLAADDAFKIHEALDEKVIHKVLGIKQTAWSDRIDDAIIGLYGLAGLAALYIYRRELLRFKIIFPFLILGFCATFLQVLLDMAGNRPDVAAMLLGYEVSPEAGKKGRGKHNKQATAEAGAGKREEQQQIEKIHHWVEASEGSVQLLAEGFFVIAFAAAAVAAKKRREEELSEGTAG